MLKINRNGRATTLSKALLTAGLLGGAALSALDSGSAQASSQLDCSFGTSTAYPSCNTINWTNGWTLGDKTLSNLDLTSAGSASGIFSFIEIIPFKMYSANVNFSPIIPPPTTGSYAYDLGITSAGTIAGYRFANVELGVDHQGGGQVVTKTVAGGGDPVLISVNGAEIGPVPLSGTSIAVTDSWVLDQNAGGVSSISNTYTQTSSVPGPLPLLGAGAAFGFSRRIRSRIKAARLV